MFAGEGMALLRPLTTPDVSVRESPPGFPSANTDWPTLSPLDVPTCDLTGGFCQYNGPQLDLNVASLGTASPGYGALLCLVIPDAGHPQAEAEAWLPGLNPKRPRHTGVARARGCLNGR